MPKNNKPEASDVNVLQVRRGSVEVCILGTTPLIVNRMAQKAINQLLLPSGRKTAADKANTLKHNPVEEFRNSVHTQQTGPTLLAMPSTAFKSGLSNAAIDIGQGVNKAQMGRLSYVEGDYVSIYGNPLLHMSIVRMADPGRTPDVRTRAILPEWACKLTVSFVMPVINATIIANLLAGAGMMQGIGDFRVQKGKGNYGSFRLCEPNDPDFVRITSTQARDAQVLAMKEAVTYDQETAELLAWFHSEVRRRELKGTDDKATRAKKSDESQEVEA